MFCEVSRGIVCVDMLYSKCSLLYSGMFFFFQAEDGIRDLVRSRGLGDVYKRQDLFRRLTFYDLLCGIV